MFCSYCMKEIEQTAEVCPYCGKSCKVTVPAHRLIPGTVLAARYIVGVAKGEGGFGITYIGRDTKLDRVVAIKEYYPSGLVNRNSTVSPVVTQTADEQGSYAYEKGCERFLTEAKTLAQVSGEVGIVNIIDFFEENNTAYIVMEYLDGMSLKDYLSTNGVLTPEQTLEILMPVMLSLEKVHNQGLIHRDISPSNIMILKNTVKLIDFGAARNATGNGNKSLSLMLKPGYAPEEQYRSKGVQGPWTDVYALCATIYKCITGITPDEANDRLHKDELKRPSELGVRVSAGFEATIMKGLSVLQQDRYQSIGELMSDLRIALSERVTMDPNSFSPAPTAPPQPAASDNDTRCVDNSQRELINAYRAPVQQPQYPQQYAQPQYQQPQYSRPQYAHSQYPQSQYTGQGAVQNQSVPLSQQPAQAIPAAAVTHGSDLDRKAYDRIKKRKRKKALFTFLMIAAVIAVVVIVILVIANSDKNSSDTSANSDNPVDPKVTLQTDANGGRKKIDTESNYASYSRTVVTAEDLKNAKDSGVRTIYFTGCQIPQEVFDNLSTLKDSLKYISFEECAGFTKIETLNELTNLTSISIQKCDLSNECMNGLDLSKLEELYRLEIMGIPKLSDLSFLKKAGKKLTTIDFSYCDVSDISPLSELGTIYSLKGDNCKISDLSPLDGKNITYVSFSNNKIKDISALKNSKSLTRLDLSSNEIESIEPLADCGDLKELNLNHNKIKSLTGAEKLIRLEKFECSDNAIPDINGLTNCTVLKYVNLSSNKLSDISLLSKNSSSLIAVFIDDNQISDLSPLSKATGLKCISFNNNKISDLSPIKDCTKMTAISGDNNGIQSLDPIKNMSSLTCISFAHNKISDMKPVGELTSKIDKSMYVLDLSNNNISQIELASGKNYQSVLIYNNPLTTLDNVKQIQGLTIAISYFDGIKLQEIKDGYLKLSIVDCPLDKQVAIEKEVGRYKVSFVTAEEIEKDTNSKKESVFKQINS